MKIKQKTKKLSKSSKKLQIKSSFWYKKPFLFALFFAFIGSFFLVKSFAASSILLVSSHLDLSNSIGASVIVDTSSPTKGNTNVVKLINSVSSTSAKAAFVNSSILLDPGEYKACMLSVSKNKTIGGGLQMVYYANSIPGAVLAGTFFSQSVKTDYSESVCVNFTNYRANSLIGAVIQNVTAGGELRIGNLNITKTGDIPVGLLQPDSRGFAPYAYIPWGDISMTAIKDATGVKNYTAAFVLSNGNCVPAWDGNSTLGLSSNRANIIRTDINNIRASGGDVTVSFGGAGGTELALACPTVATLKDAYKSVVDKYGLGRMDFDIEGAAIGNSTANELRAQALALLQRDYPNLKVFVTLSVNGNGIPSNGVNFLTQLKNNGAILAGVNIMTMDYGVRSTQLGQLAIQSANRTQIQLKTIFGSSDAVAWKSLNLTAMIGINDTQPETFSLANAIELRTFADQKKIGALSFWSLNRDKSCPGNVATLAENCSGVVQSQYQYSSILNMPQN